jgi:hypothetical protein
VPKRLSAPILVDLYPTAAVGLTSLLQGQGDITEWAPAAGIEEVRFGGFERITANFYRVVIRCIQNDSSSFEGYRLRSLRQDEEADLQEIAPYRFAVLSRQIFASRLRTAQYASRCLRRMAARSNGFFALCFVPVGNWERSISILTGHPYFSR